MSRKYLNDRWCVRCNKCTPTPYLVKHLDQFLLGFGNDVFIVDMGCGNGRNSKFLKELGYFHTMSFDMAGSYGLPMILGKEKFPVRDHSIMAILANYVLMFLNQRERAQVRSEIIRMAAPGCRLMVELYPAKDSCFQSVNGLEIMKNKLIADLCNAGWTTLHNVKHKFIMENK